MTKVMLLGLLSVLLMAGCVHRLALYAPRRTPSEAHRSAPDNADCRRCHDLAKQVDHKPDDDCRSCHKLCRGC